VRATEREWREDPIEPAELAALIGILSDFERAAQQRCDDLRVQLARAKDFAATVSRRLRNVPQLAPWPVRSRKTRDVFGAPTATDADSGTASSVFAALHQM
jgi:hypothetical protein